MSDRTEEQSKTGDARTKADAVTEVANKDEPTQPGGQSVAWQDVVAVTGAATALVTTISGLAVTGALQRMQRDHGTILIVAFSLVLAAAALWLALAIVKPAAHKGWLWWSDVDVFGRLLAATAFAVGVIVGIWGMIHTQRDQPRPSVTATLKPDTPDTLELDATATAHNLAIGERLVTLIVGLKRDASGRVVTDKRYVAVSGPDASGNVDQTVSYAFPKNVYYAVGVSASTGHSDVCDYEQESAASGPQTTGTTSTTPEKPAGPIRSVIRQRDQPGCVVIVLPAPG